MFIFEFCFFIENRDGCFYTSHGKCARLRAINTPLFSTREKIQHRLLPFANLLSYVCASDRDAYKPAGGTRDNEQWVDDVTGAQHIKEVSTLLEIAYLAMVWLNRWKDDGGRSFTMHRKGEQPGQLRLLNFVSKKASSAPEPLRPFYFTVLRLMHIEAFHFSAIDNDERPWWLVGQTCHLLSYLDEKISATWWKGDLREEAGLMSRIIAEELRKSTSKVSYASMASQIERAAGEAGPEAGTSGPPISTQDMQQLIESAEKRHVLQSYLDALKVKTRERLTPGQLDWIADAIVVAKPQDRPALQAVVNAGLGLDSALNLCEFMLDLAKKYLKRDINSDKGGIGKLWQSLIQRTLEPLVVYLFQFLYNRRKKQFWHPAISVSTVAELLPAVLCAVNDENEGGNDDDADNDDDDEGDEPHTATHLPAYFKQKLRFPILNRMSYFLQPAFESSSAEYLQVIGAPCSHNQLS